MTPNNNYIFTIQKAKLFISLPNNHLLNTTEITQKYQKPNIKLYIYHKCNKALYLCLFIIKRTYMNG